MKKATAIATKVTTRPEDFQGKHTGTNTDNTTNLGGGEMRLTDAHACDTQKQTVVQMLLIAVARGDAPPLPAGTLD